MELWQPLQSENKLPLMCELGWRDGRVEMQLEEPREERMVESYPIESQSQSKQV